jgi:signal transduction histidine kinase
MSDAIDILLVDDEPRNLDALEVILTDPAYRLIRASGGDEALRQLLEHDVAAIVLDIQMPGLSGFEVAQLIKGSRRFREVPIVFLTAHLIEDQDVLEGYGAGAVDYLTKPVKPEILRHKIGVFADLFRKTRALAELNETLEARVRERTTELEKSESALRAAARQKDEFLAILAHELRNPLAPLRMGLDLLLRAEPPLNPFRRTLSVMNRQLTHMVRLIDDLLDVARINGGILELQKERTDLVKAIQAAIDTTRPFFERRRQSISFDVESTWYSFADPVRVSQIVGNLLHNASKFTAAGGRVKVNVRYQEGMAFIDVIDEGIGIESERLPRVFDMFLKAERTKEPSGGGLGLGLPLSRRLAELHDGVLTAASAGLGHGSVFTLGIPAEPAEARVAHESSIPAPLVAHSPGLSVVVVEDNEDSAELLAIWLKDRGYSVSVAHSGTDGLELIRRVRPGVVLCDIGLPGMDGVEVCRQVRAFRPELDPVMIALTGWGMAEDRRRTQQTGFDHHLVKPVEPAVLFALLDNVSQAAELPKSAAVATLGQEPSLQAGKP